MTTDYKYASDRDFNMVADPKTGKYPQPNYGIVYSKGVDYGAKSHVLYGKFEKADNAIARAKEMFKSHTYETDNYDTITVYRFIGKEIGGYCARQIYREEVA